MKYLTRLIVTGVILVCSPPSLSAQWNHYLNKEVRNANARIDVSPNENYLLMSHSNGVHLYDIKRQRPVLILEDIVGFNSAIFTSDNDFVVSTSTGVDQITFDGNSYRREKFFPLKRSIPAVFYDYGQEKLYLRDNKNLLIYERDAKRRFIITQTLTREELIFNYAVSDQYIALVLDKKTVELVGIKSFKSEWKTLVDSMYSVTLKYIDEEQGEVGLLCRVSGQNYKMITLDLKDGHVKNKAKFKAKSVSDMIKLPNGNVLVQHGAYVLRSNGDLSHDNTFRIPELDRRGDYGTSDVIRDKLYITDYKRTESQRSSKFLIYDLNTMKKSEQTTIPLKGFDIKKLHTNENGVLVIEKKPGAFVFNGKQKVQTIPFVEQTFLTGNTLLGKSLYRYSKVDSLIIHDIPRGQTEYIEQSQRFINFYRDIDLVDGHIRMILKDKVYDISRSGDSTLVYDFIEKMPETAKAFVEYVRNPKPEYSQRKLIADAAFVVNSFEVEKKDYVDIHDVKSGQFKYQLKKTDDIPSNLENGLLIFDNETLELKVFDPVSRNSNVLFRSGNKPRSALITSDQRRVVYLYSSLRIHNIGTGQEIFVAKNSKNVYALSPNEKYLLVANKDIVEIYDMATGRHRGVITTDGHRPDYAMFFDDFYDGTEEAFEYLVRNNPEKAFTRKKDLYYKTLVKKP